MWLNKIFPQICRSFPNHRSFLMASHNTVTVRNYFESVLLQSSTKARLITVASFFRTLFWRKKSIFHKIKTEKCSWHIPLLTNEIRKLKRPSRAMQHIQTYQWAESQKNTGHIKDPDRHLREWSETWLTFLEILHKQFMKTLSKNVGFKTVPVIVPQTRTFDLSTRSFWVGPFYCQKRKLHTECKQN